MAFCPAPTDVADRPDGQSSLPYARPFPLGRDSLGMMIRWLVVMALLAGCATQQAAQPDCKMKWTGQPPVQVDSCTGRSEDLTADWHWYDYVFGIPLGIVGFYDPARNGV